MELSLNVMTLNCWGLRIPFFQAQFTTERFRAIGDLILKSNLDVVVLQEVWSNSDYVALSSRILDNLPYTHYFYSGYIGGGVCVYSKYPILETMYHNFPVNGHAHKIFHGDWYGSKGCGLVVLKLKELTVNVYAAHMHARYSHTDEFDEYATHRAAQAFSLSQFVKHTSASCDAIILAGDFNSTPTELAYQVIRSNAVVSDAWLEKNKECGDSAGFTCDTPDNFFTSSGVKAALPHGQRIDYVFYRSNDMAYMKLESCQVLTDKVPDMEYDYSDHYPVIARMTLKRDITAHQVPDLNVGVRTHCVKELITIMEKGLSKARYTRYFYFVTGLLSLMMLLLCREHYVGDSGTFHFVLEILQGVMAVAACLSFWISNVISRLEQNAYLAQKHDLENLMKSATYGKMGKAE